MKDLYFLVSHINSHNFIKVKLHKSFDKKIAKLCNPFLSQTIIVRFKLGGNFKKVRSQEFRMTFNLRNAMSDSQRDFLNFYLINNGKESVVLLRRLTLTILSIVSVEINPIENEQIFKQKSLLFLITYTVSHINSDRLQF